MATAAGNHPQYAVVKRDSLAHETREELGRITTDL